MIKVVSDILYLFGLRHNAQFYKDRLKEKGPFYKVEELYYNPKIQGWIVVYETDKPYSKETREQEGEGG